jgi:hypothetical protein
MMAQWVIARSPTWCSKHKGSQSDFSLGKVMDNSNRSVLADYLDLRYSSVPGFSSQFSARIMTGLILWQQSQGIEGDIGEIGVYQGRSMIALALAAAPKDKIVAVDTFAWPVDCLSRFLTNAKQFLVNQEALVPLAANSASLSSRDLINAGSGRRFRFLHIDGDHSPEALARDLTLAIAALTRDGVICLDDMLHPLYPELPIVVHSFLKSKRDLRVFCIIDRADIVAASKYLICNKSYFAKYSAAITELFKIYVFKYSAEFRHYRATIVSSEASVLASYEILNEIN